MAVVVAAGTAFSVAANVKSADKVTGQYQHTEGGVYTLIAFGSATGLNVTCSVGGVALVDDQPIPYTGTAGGLDASAHVIAVQALVGGRNELTFRNTTGGALTVDYILFFDPVV